MKKNNASFRDPSGFVFVDNGKVYRQINKSYRKEFDKLVNSGLYDELSDDNLLVVHKDVTKTRPLSDAAYKIIQPKTIPFVSYPYEWSFSMLKDAALLTLDIQKRAIEKGMILKDASAYNVQFVDGRPIFIDTLSFDVYKEGEPWVAYKQFCQHFLAPLLAMAYTDIRLNHLLRTNIDGVPLDLTDKLLPGTVKLKPSVKMHISMQTRLQSKYADKSGDVKVRKVSKFALLGLVNSLEKAISKLNWEPKDTEWVDYYTFTNYSDKSFDLKKSIISGFLEKTKPSSVWDLGANNGLFSRIASESGIMTVSSDIDPAAVEQNYRLIKEKSEADILPLVIDLTNPSPALGWANKERESLIERGPADMVFALALIHHLAISNNVPLKQAAEFFAAVGKHLIIEFVPKGDSQVDKLLSTREDIFPNYNEAGFEKAFKSYFDVLSSKKIDGSKRTLYLMRKL